MRFPDYIFYEKMRYQAVILYGYFNAIKIVFTTSKNNFSIYIFYLSVTSIRPVDGFLQWTLGMQEGLIFRLVGNLQSIKMEERITSSKADYH